LITCQEFLTYLFQNQSSHLIVFKLGTMDTEPRRVLSIRRIRNHGEYSLAAVP